MKRILLIMHRRMLSDALTQSARGDPRFDFKAEHSYKMAPTSAEVHRPDIAVVEISEDGAWNAGKCLTLCGAIRKALPDCKLMLLCPEGNKDACDATIQAKQEGKIDDFVYYDTSTNYLLSKLEAL